MEKYFEKLGKLSLAILEHFVEDKLGKGFVDELHAPTKRTLAVATALERTQNRFIKEFEDKIFSENFLIKTSELSLSIQTEAVGRFYDHPTDPVFSNILQFIATDNFPSFSVQRVEHGVKEYITILVEELVQVDETFRQNTSAVAIVRSERWQKQILDKLSEKEKVDKGDLWAYLPSGTAAIVEKIRENSLDFFARHISDYVPDYVEHSLDHPDRALKTLNSWLLDEEQKQYLANNSWTLFFLYASVYLYNIGLSSIPFVEVDGLVANSREALLSIHAKRGQLIIEKFWSELGIEDKLQASILSAICLACQESKLEDVSLKRRIPYQQTGQTINLQFIVGCIKLLHSLDLNQTRLPYLFERFLSQKEEISNTFEFSGIGPHGNYPDTISVFIRCNSMNIHRVLKSLEGYTQTLMSEINRNINPRFRFTQIVYDIENVGYEPIDYKFKVEVSSALEVFMGTSIYAHKATFLRELIQNSLDACNMRRMYSSSYEPKISVERKSDRKTIIVRDNGVGMDKNWVEKYFLLIGISFYRSEEFENITNLDMGFSPISRFGIGILSCFMVADKIIVRTKKLGAVGLELSISDFRNYFEVKQDSLLEQGTEITLTLKPDYVDIDCLGYLLENIKYAQEPIEYYYFNGEKRIIGQQPVSLTDSLKINFWKKEWENYIEERIPFSSPVSEGYISLLKSKQESGEIFQSGGMSVCEVKISQDGIFICNEPNLLPRWIKKNIVCRINLRDEDRVDVSVSRISLLQNSKYVGLRLKINNGLILLMDKIFELSFDLSENREKYNSFVKSFIKDNISLDAFDSSLAEILRRHYCFEIHRASNAIDDYLFYSEIPDKENIYFLYGGKNSRSKKINIGKGGDFILGEDARVFLLLNPDKSYRENMLLKYDEISNIKEYLDSEIILRRKNDLSSDQDEAE